MKRDGIFLSASDWRDKQESNGNEGSKNRALGFHGTSQSYMVLEGLAV
jgi:hypothetical protein